MESLWDYIKVNVDGSSYKNYDNAGFEGFLRNDRRIWIQDFLNLLIQLITY